MPIFRIISQADTAAAHRKPRGIGAEPDERGRISTVEAADLSEAMSISRRSSDHQNRRIVAVEEIHPGIEMPSNEELTDALTNPERNQQADEPLMEKKEFEDPYVRSTESVYGGGNFVYVANQVATALRDSGVVPGLHLSLLTSDISGGIEYSMVEVYDQATAVYHSHGCELDQLTDNRSATGWDGVLAIARGLIMAAQPLH